jgi:hypothetical protein
MYRSCNAVGYPLRKGRTHHDRRMSPIADLVNALHAPQGLLGAKEERRGFSKGLRKTKGLIKSV